MSLSDGISQDYRSHHIVGDSYVYVDEHSFHDLVCYVKEFAKNIKYYNLNNQHEGYWNELLLADQIITLSEIIVLNIKPLEDKFNQDFDINLDNTGKYYTQLVEIIIELAAHIDQWYKQLFSYEIPTTEGIIKEIDYLIREQLAEDLYFCIELVKTAPAQDLSEQTATLQAFDKIWWAKQYQLPAEGDIDINNHLKKTFYNFNNAFYYLKKTAYKYFDHSLKSQQHSPYLSLLFTFIELYIKSREKLNTFPKKHHQFYYNDILKITPKTYQPDHAFLLFTLKNGIEEVLIPKGTRFIGGKDKENKKIIYAADNDVVITPAKIGHLYTLYFENNKLIYPQCGCTNMLKNEIDVVETESYSPHDSMKWPLFGEPARDVGQYAEVGFAISDPNLLVKEGLRNIKITFDFTTESFKAFLSQLENIKGAYSLCEIFIKLLSNMFNISITTSQGWLPIENYIINTSLIDPALPPDTIDVAFTLAHDAPDVAGYRPETHGHNYSGTDPMLKFLLNNEAHLYPYPLLRHLELDKITTKVQVKDIKKIWLTNEFGPIDVSNPFYLFGPTPRLNSYFIFGNDEISQKKLSCLNLAIKWNNLPKEALGLSEYFQEYGVHISKYDYTCSITFLNNGYWLPEENGQPEVVQLFAAGEKNKHRQTEKLNLCSEFAHIDTSHYHTDDRKTNSTGYIYNNYAVGGFVKFTLINPAFGFGHHDYPLKLADRALLNAKKQSHAPLPNQPFSPIVDLMSLGYTAESEHNFTRQRSAGSNASNRFYHLYPWGHEDMSQSTRPEKAKLLPTYNNQGYLFIALEHSKPYMTLTLFFNLLDDSTPEAEATLPEISWEYLSSNLWKPLPKANLISDSTQGFLQTGIVTLYLPGNINKQNTILSSQYHWIRISCKAHLENVSSVTFVSTQAIQVTWDNQGNSLAHLDAALPEMTISKPEKNLPGIKTIVQPASSFNGKPPENLQQTKIRVGERLRHKNRAITPWDYELLILEKFPEIHKVKCFPHMSPEKRTHPGHVLIAVIRTMDVQNLRMDSAPCVNNVTLIKIKNFVKEVASEWTDIEVRNALFERIMVRCAVKIKAGLDAGYFIHQLNLEITQFLSPWQTDGGDEPGFGKVVKCTDVLSFVQSLDFIEFATNFSMLKITHNKQTQHTLSDTAGRTYNEMQEAPLLKYETGKGQKELKPSAPWSILISAEKHAISLMEAHHEVEPVKTGINQLEVGDTFVVTSKNIDNENR